MALPPEESHTDRSKRKKCRGHCELLLKTMRALYLAGSCWPLRLSLCAGSRSTSGTECPLTLLLQCPTTVAACSPPAEAFRNWLPVHPVCDMQCKGVSHLKSWLCLWIFNPEWKKSLEQVAQVC